MENNFLIKVLMVDDDELFALLVGEALKLEDNIEFRAVTTANAFFGSLNFQSDIAIIDYNLPDKNGLEILAELKQVNSAIVPIVLSGQEDISVVV